MRRGAGGKRRDQNEPAIIAALRAVGATVEQLSAPDLPDLLVGYRNFTWLFEVKMPKGKLSPGQERWLTEWRGGHVYVVRTVAEAFTLIGIEATRSKAV